MVQRFPSESSWLPGSLPDSQYLIPWLHNESPWLSRITSGFPGLGSLVAWIHFLVPYTCLNSCLVKAPGCLNLVPVSLDLVPWVPGKCSMLPGFTSWFHGCLVKLSGCLNLLPGSFDLVPWLPTGSWLRGLGSMIPSRHLVACIHFLVLCPWCHSSPLKVSGCLYLVPGSLDLIPWLPCEGSWLPGFNSWCHGCLVKVYGCLNSLPGCRL